MSYNKQATLPKFLGNEQPDDKNTSVAKDLIDEAKSPTNKEIEKGMEIMEWV